MLIQNEDLFGAPSTAINEVNISDSHAKRNELLGRYNYCYYHNYSIVGSKVIVSFHTQY